MVVLAFGEDTTLTPAKALGPSDGRCRQFNEGRHAFRTLFPRDNGLPILYPVPTNLLFSVRPLSFLPHFVLTGYVSFVGVKTHQRTRPLLIHTLEHTKQQGCFSRERAYSAAPRRSTTRYSACARRWSRTPTSGRRPRSGRSASRRGPRDRSSRSTPSPSRRTSKGDETAGLTNGICVLFFRRWRRA